MISKPYSPEHRIRTDSPYSVFWSVPSVRNALPDSLRDPELTLDIFRRQLKTLHDVLDVLFTYLLTYLLLLLRSQLAKCQCHQWPSYFWLIQGTRFIVEWRKQTKIPTTVEWRLLMLRDVIKCRAYYALSRTKRHPFTVRCYAERGYATECRPSVCLSIRDVQVPKIISRLISLRFMLGLTNVHVRSGPTGTPQN